MARPFSRDAQAQSLALVTVVIGCLVCAPAAAQPPWVRALALPEPARVVGGRRWADVDAIEGEAPNEAHPRGTVIVAEAAAAEPSPAVTEWDLSTGALVRSAPLPLSSSFADLALVAAGAWIHVVAAQPRGPVVYLRLTRSLAVDAIERLGAGERPRVATDGAVVAFLWSGWSIAPTDAAECGWQLAVLDVEGRHFGAVRVARTTLSTFAYGEPIAVAGGLVFVVRPDRAGAVVDERQPDGRVERSLSVDGPADDTRLFVAAGRLYFTDDCDVVELWPHALSPAPRARLPRRDNTTRACTAFRAAADGRGRLVTAEGEILSPDYRVERRFVDPLGIVVRPLWVGRQPALLVVGGPGGQASIAWGDADGGR